MLNDCKNALRIKASAYDDEINLLIEACLFDLRRCGIVVPDSPDMDIRLAVILYVKAMFGNNAPDTKAIFYEAYERARLGLILNEKNRG